MNRVVVFNRGYRTISGVFGHKPKQEQHVMLTAHVTEARAKNANLFRLITAYRKHGHVISEINPVAYQPAPLVSELNHEQYLVEMDQLVATDGLVHMLEKEVTIKDVLQLLKQTYCGSITSDLSYLSSRKQEWMAKALEESTNKEIKPETKMDILKILTESEQFDEFLGKKFPTLKRYGLEGAEGMLVFFKQLFQTQKKFTDVIIAMTHRGRLNLLTGLLGVQPALVFNKIKGGLEMSADSSIFTGDVLSHLFVSSVVEGKRVSLLPNPSHLEIVNPVSMGKTRAKQLRILSGDYSDTGDQSVLNIQVHGDAAFAGQGLNQEMLAFTLAPHFYVGGSVHLVVNNQLGFTTPCDRGRSSRYSSDLAKMIDAPVIHVNGDCPEAIMKATEIAINYQTEIREDVFVEMHCYRRRGHNELDDPTFTNPELYNVIKNLETLPRAYCKELVNHGSTTQEEVDTWKENYSMYLNDELKTEVHPPVMSYQNQWDGFQAPGKQLTTWDTGFNTENLRYLGLRSVSFPPSFQIHPHLLKTHVANRTRMMLEPTATALDWSTAETLAIGSLLLQEFNVRISGQDVGRGTFSQRHVMLVDQSTGDIHIPLNTCEVKSQGKLELANSVLSEESVLAFEYGMSLDSPNNLIIWEAQFGDFVNGAQNVIDTYISSGEAKWTRSSALTLLLPHGYDGAGPEHSSCRIERFLQLTNSSENKPDSDCVNMQVAWPTTPAQYFHLLRRQMIRNFRCPLVVVAPKTLLRLSAATSSLAELEPGTGFKNVILEDNPRAKRVVFTSGKHFYTLLDSKPHDVAIVRLESLVPFPVGELQAAVQNYPQARRFIWSQEEPMNQGAWNFIRPRFESLVGVKLDCAARPVLPVPAYGLSHLHRESLDKVILETFTK